LVAPREKDRALGIQEKTGTPPRWTELPAMPTGADQTPAPPPMTTLLIDGGRQDKLRPGDLLGALTGDVGLPGDAVGSISIGPKQTFVAIARLHADLALRGLQASKIKGRSFRARRLG
jgi:ATP-independent RNA helicase DbpA